MYGRPALMGFCHCPRPPEGRTVPLAALMTAFPMVSPDIVREVWKSFGSDSLLCHSALNEIQVVQRPLKGKTKFFPRIRKTVRFSENHLEPPASRLEAALQYARAMTHGACPMMKERVNDEQSDTKPGAAHAADQQPLRSAFFENATRVSLKLKRKAQKARLELQRRSFENGGISGEDSASNIAAADGSLNSTLSESSCLCVGREEAILHGRRLLARRLTGLNVKEHEMIDDGNCLFRAVSHQLYASQDHHLRLRQLACIQIEKQCSIYWAYFDGSKDYQQYLSELKRPGVWGDEIALKALCDALGVVVYVLLSTDGNWYLRYVPRFCTTAQQIGSARKLFLSYLSPIHYNSITYTDDLPISLSSEETINFPELKSVKKPSSKAYWV